MFSLANILGVLGRVPAAVWLVLVLGGWGLWGHHKANALQAAVVAEKADAVVAAQVAERAANKSNQKVGDSLVVDTKKRSIRTRAAAQRLRDKSTSFNVETAGAACRSDAAPVELIRDETREHLIELADDADATADALRACQAYIRDVVKPAGFNVESSEFQR